MATDYKAFNPQKVGLIFGLPNAPGASHRVRGYGEDSMVEIAFDSDFGSIVKGADGENRHVDMADRSGTITVNLGQHSQTNAVFTAIAAANVPIPVSLIDKSSAGDLFTAGSVKLRTHPGLSKGANPGENVWVWQFTKGTVILAGAFEE